LDPRISIFIPVYKESDLLEPLLDGLLRDPYDEKELFVIVDEATERSIDLGRRMRSDVSFIFNGERVGKANALNAAIKYSEGEILLFLDSDVALSQNSILKTIAEEMEGADILEIKKKIIRDSFLARAVNYDYLSFNYTNWVFSRFLGQCLGFNGAAFAIKRETFQSLGGFRRVICEDLDLGIRSFLNDMKFRYTENIEVQNKVSPSWRQWFKQRKRWGIGLALWIREYYRDLLSSLRRHPKILIPSLLILFPSLPLFVMNTMIPNGMYLKALSLILLFLATKQLFLLPPILLTSVGMTLMKNFVSSAVSFGIYSLIFYFFARKLNYAFNLPEFVFFYFIYNSLWLLITVVSIISIMIWPDKINIDWKI